MKFVSALSALTLTVAVSGTSLAAAECTAEGLQERAMAVTTEVQKLAASDPAKMNEIMTKMGESAQAMQSGGSLEEVCAMYDQLEADLGLSE